MKSIQGLALLAFVGIMVMACSKKETTPPTAAETNGITLAGASGASKTWTIATFQKAVNGAAAQDITSGVDACFLDNTFTFTNNASQDYENDEGATRCYTSDPAVIEKGSWAFTEDGKNLLIDATPNSAEYFLSTIGMPLSITNLTATSFTASFSYTDSLNNKNVLTLSFVKK